MGKMKLAVKSSASRKDAVKSPREQKESLKAKRSLKPRIDEEGLFRLFTADIIKMKTKFTR
jgi:hypothetical protein